VTISLKQGAEHLTLRITDDGGGFIPETRAQDHQMGIKGIRERADMIGADLELESRPAQGTTISLIWGREK